MKTTCCPSKPLPQASVNRAVTAFAGLGVGSKLLLGDQMLTLPAGTFRMGSDSDEGESGDGEAPARMVSLDAFRMAATTVTNQQFAAFVANTGYVTQAEETGWSYVFAGLLPDDFAPTRGVVDAPWWREVSGASWAHPEGPQSGVQDRLDHPVVQVAWFDAVAYCEWAGAQLPTEAQWEYAARGGLQGKRYPWGDELTPQAQHRCNIWQGRFPVSNTVEDGYYGTAPANAFAPNGFGLYNTCGNVWEWCADWFGNTFTTQALSNPLGAAAGTRRVIRGGSFLCHDSYCNRYRVAARSANDPAAATSHMGFRCAANA